MQPVTPGRLPGQLPRGGDDQYRRARAPGVGPAVLQELPAVDDRHHQVEHDRLRALRAGAIDAYAEHQSSIRLNARYTSARGCGTWPLPQLAEDAVIPRRAPNATAGLRSVLVLLGVEPALTLVLAWTNDLHQLMWPSVAVRATPALLALT